MSKLIDPPPLGQEPVMPGEERRASASAPHPDASPEPELLLGANGRVYVNASVLSPEHQQGRRVLCAVETTPEESSAVARSLGEVSLDLIVGILPASKGGER